MASGDNVDVIEVVETNFIGAMHPSVDNRLEQSTAEEDCECPTSPSPASLPPAPNYPSL
jgi:hypothetical protein